MIETAYVLTTVYRVPREVVVERMIELLNKTNINVNPIKKPLVIEALSMCRPSKRVSFGDALLRARSRSDNLAVSTLDKRFPTEAIPHCGRRGKSQYWRDLRWCSQRKALKGERAIPASPASLGGAGGSHRWGESYRYGSGLAPVDRVRPMLERYQRLRERCFTSHERESPTGSESLNAGSPEGCFPVVLRYTSPC